jgi:probable HAF family extracellular repeat protein
MINKLAVAVLFWLPISLLAAQTSPVPLANLRFSNIDGRVGLFPLAINADSVAGQVCCETSADPYTLRTVGFLLNPPGSFLQFLQTLPPGGSSSFASGINASGTTAVGGYCVIDCASLVSQHGFSLTLDYADGFFSFSDIDYPGAYATIANGVNSSFSVVGTYCPRNTCYFQGPDHGFAYIKGVFTEIKFPGSASTGVFGINDAGDMVGGYSLSASPIRLSKNSASNSTVKAPNRAAIPLQIKEDGIQVYGFLLSGEVFKSLNPPGSIATYPAGINNSGIIVGTFIDATDHLHGFRFQDGKFQQIDHPNSSLTTADGISDKNEIVGTYEASNGISYGYIAK